VTRASHFAKRLKNRDIRHVLYRWRSQGWKRERINILTVLIVS